MISSLLSLKIIDTIKKYTKLKRLEKATLDDLISGEFSDFESQDKYGGSKLISKKVLNRAG